MFAFILRFLRTIKQQTIQRLVGRQRRSSITPISIEELKVADSSILKLAQQQSFKEEVHSLSPATDKPSVKKSSSIVKLDPVLIGGLLRVGGRLQRAPIDNEAKYRIILPKKHHIVVLIVQYYHRISVHSGLEYTLSLIRQRYWLINARSTVRRMLNECFDCRKLQSSTVRQKMASLPEDRVTPSKPPFTYTGVDYFGPFEVRLGRNRVRKYGIIFTCLTLRVVHIQVANSLDTESFINALRRFIARRGQPEDMRSDNGGNFVREERELREAVRDWNDAQIHDFLLQRSIKWTFHPPERWCERCIRAVRKVIKALVKEQVLDDEDADVRG